MAIPMRKFAALCLGAVLITGCTSVKVIRNPDDADEGVRFYRPKPYLLVTPADTTGRLLNLKLEYLPDFNEEYSAHLKGKASVALKDGWNLVGVNTKEAPKEEDKPPAKIEDLKLPPAVVAATNVPIGYYESVYGYAGSKKFLQGWRYVGMTMLGGGQPNVCRVPGHNPNCPPGAAGANGCISGPLYGLVFFNGVMTFRQLDEIANNQLCPMFVNPAPTDVAPTQANEVRLDPTVRSGDIKVEDAPKPPVVPPAPPTPAPNPAPGGSASLSRPRVTPSLVAARPAAPAPASPSPSSPSMNRPMTTPAPSVAASKPAAAQGTYVPLAKKTAAVAPVVAAKVPAAKKPGAPSSLLDQDPLMGTPPSKDQDLFRTGSSPRP